MLTPAFSRRSYLPYPLERTALVAARMLYRVRASGVEQIPARGGGLLVANHLSYVDVVMLQLACPRPIRFVGHAGFLRGHAFFAWVFRLTGTIPASASDALAATRRTVRALAAGELVCVFPEGGISRTGQLMGLRRGFEIMARQAGVPVIPVAHDGLWGSVFSFAGNKYLWKSPRLRRTPVFVAFGAPLSPDEAGMAAEFVGLVREVSIIGQLAGLRRIPPRTPIITSKQILSCANRTFRCTPSTHRYT